MSITIISQPSVTLSADNALFVVSSDKSAQPNFRFVADVSGTTLLSRLKCDKLPNNQGFFNVARVIETLVPITKPAITFFQDPKIASKYDVGFKEEYGTTPAVFVSGVANASGIVFQGYKRQWEDFVSSGYYTLGSAAKILSKQPTKRKTRLGENDFVSVLFHIVTSVPDFTINITNRLRTFSVTSGLVNTDVLDGMFNLGLAGIYSLTSGQTSDSRAGSFRNPFWTNADEFAFYDARATADGAISDSNACAFGIFDGLVDFNGYDTYQAEIIYVHDGDTFYFSEDHTTETYAIDYEVESCERFVPQRLFFKNSLGGFDGYTFTMKNRKTGNMTKQTFGKNQNIYGTKVAETIYSGEFEEVMTLNSDWLIDANWMSELIYSPQVYLQIGSELVEAIVNTSSFTFHTRPQDKLQQLQVEVKIAYKNNVI
jgi:hypothetical protein